jgi:uncharacterized protein
VNEKILSPEEAIDILNQMGCSKKVIAHCKAVSDLSVNLAKEFKKKGFQVDIKLVEIGALLHDIGRSKTHDINHAIIGSQIAKSLNLSKSIVAIIECHIGGGISLDEAKKLGLPDKDYFPETLEEKIVAYSDKLIEGAKVVSIKNTIKNLRKKLGSNHPAIDRIIKLHKELYSMIGDFNSNSHNS